MLVRGSPSRLSNHARSRRAGRRVQSEIRQDLRQRRSRDHRRHLHWACTLVLGIVPLRRICVTPKASPRISTRLISTRAGRSESRVTSFAGNRRSGFLLSAVGERLDHFEHGGLTAEMKHVVNGPELWGPWWTPALTTLLCLAEVAMQRCRCAARPEQPARARLCLSAGHPHRHTGRALSDALHRGSSLPMAGRPRGHGAEPAVLPDGVVSRSASSVHAAGGAWSMLIGRRTCRCRRAFTTAIGSWRVR